MSPDAPRRPRRLWTRAEQAAHLADFAASGLSATAFCRRLGVGRPIFLATGVTDLRCGMHRLYALILDPLGQEPRRTA